MGELIWGFPACPEQDSPGETQHSDAVPRDDGSQGKTYSVSLEPQAPPSGLAPKCCCGSGLLGWGWDTVPSAFTSSVSSR